MWYDIEYNGDIMSLIVIIEDVNTESKILAKQISKNIFDYYISSIGE